MITLRRPHQALAGCIWLPRFIDKCRLHFAVTLPPDYGKLSLTEITRVIELYNTYSGSTRTGQYHAQALTEDGFAPWP